MNADRRKRISAVDTQAIRDAVANLKEMIENAKGEYEQIRDEEQDYYDNMPESFQQGEKGTTAEDAISALDDVVNALDETSELDNIVTALDDVDGASF